MAPVAAVTSSHQGLPVGCLWFTHALSGAWQARTGDHAWETRCSRLDRLGCDHGRHPDLDLWILGTTKSSQLHAKEDMAYCYAKR